MSNLISDLYPDVLIAEGFDDCIVGVDDSTFNQPVRVVYLKSQMIDTLIKDHDMDWEEAIEYLEFNVWGAYVGEQTPIYVNDILNH